MPFFSQKEKRKHYNAVAKGEKPVKSNSKFNKEEQIAYAKGQCDARNESARITAYKHSTDEQRSAYKKKQAERRKQYLESKKNNWGVK